MRQAIPHRFLSTLLTLWRRLPLPGWLRWRIIWGATPKYLVGVLAVVWNEEGHILLFRHTYRPAYAWALPSGWLEPFEPPARAIEREVLEESGFTVHTIAPLAVDAGRNQKRVDLFFHCRLEGGSFQPSPEVCEARFFPVDQLPADLHPYQRRFIGGVRPARS